MVMGVKNAYSISSWSVTAWNIFEKIYRIITHFHCFVAIINITSDTFTTKQSKINTKPIKLRRILMVRKLRYDHFEGSSQTELCHCKGLIWSVIKYSRFMRWEDPIRVRLHEFGPKSSLKWNQTILIFLIIFFGWVKDVMVIKFHILSQSTCSR